MQERGADPADWEPPGLAPIAYAHALGVVGPAIIATHLTDAREPELAVLARLGAHVVLCPRAALHVEVKLPPLTALLAAGITPGLGTDSLAASPSLDVLEEALALHRRFPTVAPSVLCAMATSFGAHALGLEHRLGRIAPGLAPGVLLIEGRTTDPLAHVLAQAGRPRRVLVRPGSAL
jgi:5-methylthioadenosine/S-adenosylhomocysteine deaminase